MSLSSPPKRSMAPTTASNTDFEWMSDDDREEKQAHYLWGRSQGPFGKHPSATQRDKFGNKAIYGDCAIVRTWEDDSLNIGIVTGLLS